MSQPDELRIILMRIERVASIIERDALNTANQVRAREIIILTEMAMKHVTEKIGKQHRQEE